MEVLFVGVWGLRVTRNLLSLEGSDGREEEMFLGRLPLDGLPLDILAAVRSLWGKSVELGWLQ